VQILISPDPSTASSSPSSSSSSLSFSTSSPRLTRIGQILGPLLLFPVFKTTQNIPNAEFHNSSPKTKTKKRYPPPIHTKKDSASNFVNQLAVRANKNPSSNDKTRTSNDDPLLFLFLLLLLPEEFA
jgi:hypothetical protein